MVLFFTTTLLLACFGMVAMFTVKRWELRSRRVFFASARPALSGLFHITATLTERVLPTLLGRAVRRLTLVVSSFAHRTIAWSILATERMLEHSLWRLRHTTAPKQSQTDVSYFLREVAEHKKQLARSSITDALD